MRRWGAAALGCALALAGSACAGGADTPVHRPTRADYAAFRARHPRLLEPNYLPFMATPVQLESRARRSVRRAAEALGLSLSRPPALLVFCRWNEADFPLAVYVEPPAISPELALDLAGREPEDYVAAVERAFRLWESTLEGLVRFERAPSARAADLVLRLTAEPIDADDPGVQVLGTTPLGGACRVLSGAATDDRLEVRFEVPELRVYVADDFSLLLPDQVERIALHEIGHALGMRTHSPIPADLMYPVVRDRLPRGELGTEDVNSFVSLYSLPNGAVYRVLPAVPAPPPPAPLPEGPPEVELAPHVDARLGFELQTPEGWPREPTPYGVVAMNGVPWDYEASFQLNVYRFATIEDFVERFGPSYLVDATLLSIHERRVAGRRAREVSVLTDFGMYERMTLIESGDGRVLVAVAECSEELRAAYGAWFAAVLGSLEVSGPAERPRSRTYGPTGAR